MQWRVGATLAMATLLVLGGFAAVAGAGSAVTAPTSAASQAEDQEPTATLCAGGPPDPDTDVLGWEAGCWHNQSIAIDQSDGLNASERNATIARTMARVEVVRQLEFQRTVPVELRSREAYRAELANDTVGPELTTFDNVKFEALFLIGQDEDSIEVQNENAGLGVLGFYSPEQEAIVLISENASRPQVDELTLAHELTHALQDQHFNLSRYDARTRDGANAQSGLIEGDARLVELRYDERCDTDAWAGSCLAQSDGDGAGGELANIGTYVMKFQPYSDGPTFLTSIYNEGGWDAVNLAYEHPPASSEQVIHPERYPTDEPRTVTIVDRQSDEWERVRPPERPDYGTVGESALTAMFVFPLYESGGQTQIIRATEWLNTTADGELSSFDPLNYDNRYAAGWDGDRLHVYVNDANETAYVWRLAWDTSRDAREFVEGYHQVLEYWGGESVAPDVWAVEDGPFADAFHVRVTGRTVTIVNAPTVAELSTVREGIQTTPTPSPSPTATPTAAVSPALPAQDTPGLPTTTAPGQPGFGVVPVLAALAVVLLGWRRRR